MHIVCCDCVVQVVAIQYFLSYFCPLNIIFNKVQFIMLKKIALALIALVGAAVMVSAQNKQISGKVTDANGDPVPGASVLLRGTTTGTVTNLDGTYVLSAAPTDVLEFTFFGMKSQNVTVGDHTVINVTMQDDSMALDEVVVTAMGISRSEKTLGYSATTVKSDDIVSARSTNLTNAMAGKVAGVQVQASSSDPGAASNIIIRGFSSINGSNQPLYVVDGVPVSNVNMNGQSKSTAVAGIGNIASEDIESMTILKGAAATALYGSRAANGVVIVTTRSGKKGGDRDFTVEYSGGLQLRQVAMFPEMQNMFGQGWNGTQTFIENGSWGPALDGSTQVYGPIWNNQQRIHEFDAKPTNVKDFFELGVSHNHNVAISGASSDNKLTYYLSYGHTSDNGAMPGKHDVYKRNTISYNSSYEAAKWLKVTSQISFANNKSDVVGSYQGTSVIDGLYEFPRDLSIVDLKDLSNPFNTPEAYLTPYGITNPYWAIENNYNHTDAKEVRGKAQIDIKPVKGLTLTYRFGFDYNDLDSKMGYPEIKLDDALINDDKGYAPSNMNQAGWVYAHYRRGYETNHDFLANYTNSFFDNKFSLTAIAGVNINERYATSLTGQTDELTFETGFWDLSNGATKSTLSESQSKRRAIGLFADVTLGYNEELFLDITARNDWSSTLPINANSYFYPGVTLSWIFTNRLQNKDVLSFGKLRAAYGMTGNDASVYRTSVSYTQAYANGYYYGSIADFPMHSTNAFIAAASKGSSTLRPELTSEAEFGANLQFFGGRIGFDAAYYYRVTNDQIFTLPVDPATGYTSMVTNFGKVRNTGYELVLNTVPVQTRDFSWSLDFNFSQNFNKVVTLPEGLDEGKTVINSFSAGSDAVYVYAEEGKPMGQFYTYLPARTEDGKLIVDGNGQPIKSTEIEDTGKNFQNKWTAGINTALTYKGFSLSAVLDVRMGGYMFSRTKNLMQFTGNGIMSTYNKRRPFVIPDSVTETADGKYVENTTPIYLNDSSYQTFYDSYGAGECGEFYLIDRSYAKLRNISLTYSLPKKWLKKMTFSGLSVTAFVNNVFTWTAKSNVYIDPETTSFAGDGDLASQFGELYSNPSNRIYGFNVSIKF